MAGHPKRASTATIDLPMLPGQVGPPSRRPAAKKAPLSADERRRIRRLKATGTTTARIGELMDRHQDTIRKFLTGDRHASALAADKTPRIPVIPTAVARASQDVLDEYLTAQPRARVSDLYPPEDQLLHDSGTLTPSRARYLAATVPAIIALYNPATFAAHHFPGLLSHQLRWLRFFPAAFYRFILSGPRHGKSHVLTMVLPCWILAGGGESKSYYRNPDAPLRNHQIMIVSATDDQANKCFLAIEAHLTDPASSIVTTYGRFKEFGLPWSQAKGRCIIAGRDRIGTSGDFSLMTLGLRSNVFGRGARWILLDDVVTGDNCKTILDIDKAFTWIQANVFSRLDDTDAEPGYVWGVGHHLPLPNDLYTRFAKMIDLTMDAEASLEDEDAPRLFEFLVQPAILDWEKKVVLAPERMSWKKLMSARSRQPDTFMSMYQQISVDAENAFCLRPWIYGGEQKMPHGASLHFTGCLDMDRVIGEPGKLLDNEPTPVRAVMIDPSPTAYWGILCADLRISDRYSPTLIDIYRSKLYTYQAIAILEEWALHHRYEFLIIEKNSAHFLVQDDKWIAFTQRHPNIKVILHDTTGNKNDQIYGEGTIPDDIRSARVRIPWGDQHSRTKFQPLIDELLQELTTTDLRMALWIGKWHSAGLIAWKRGNIESPSTTGLVPRAAPTRLARAALGDVPRSSTPAASSIDRRAPMTHTYPRLRSAGLPG